MNCLLKKIEVLIDCLTNFPSHDFPTSSSVTFFCCFDMVARPHWETEHPLAEFVALRSGWLDGGLRARDLTSAFNTLNLSSYHRARIAASAVIRRKSCFGLSPSRMLPNKHKRET